MTKRIVKIDPQDLPEVERLRALIGAEIYTDHLSNALAAFARGEQPRRACPCFLHYHPPRKWWHLTCACECDHESTEGI